MELASSVVHDLQLFALETEYKVSFDLQLSSAELSEVDGWIEIGRLTADEDHQFGEICSDCQLGEGLHGVVCRAKLDGFRAVAVKKVKAGMSDQKALIEETKMLRALRDENILQFYGHSWLKVDGDRQLLLITEYMQRGSLYDPVDLIVHDG